MAQLEEAKVNPDLVSERNGATFDREKLTHLLDGGERRTKRRREIEQMILNDKNFIWPEYHFLDRSERYAEALRQSANFVRKLQEIPDADSTDRHHMLSLIFPNIPTPIGLHLSMFANVIESQASDEQKAEWQPMAKNWQFVGTYAQTEMGHGTHVRGLETTATYDPKTEQFVLHSPTITSTKFWPGSLGKTCNYCVVMAQLYTQGKCHGVHSFMVQLRDFETHEPLPGITVGDIGPKFGYDTVDNGFLRFNHVRIPRKNMFMKLSQVSEDGTYVKSLANSKLNYGAMVYMRAMLIDSTAANGLCQATTIAIRYSCVRHQSELKPGDAEPKVLDYQTQQYKLLPLLATAYALRFTGARMKKDYERMQTEIMAGNFNSLAELHATSSGLKSLSTFVAMYGIEQCRLACGGHGYSQASGIPLIYVNVTPACTYEGENTVLYLQTARYLIKVHEQVSRGHAVTGSVGYLSRKRSLRSTIDQHLRTDSIIEAYEHRAARLIEKASRRLNQLKSSGKEAYDAWNLSAVFLVKAAECHSYVYAVESFRNVISTVTDKAVLNVLNQLFELYALYGISQNAADFLEDGYLIGPQLDVVNGQILMLLAKLRPNAVALVDAFDYHDRHLQSVLGRYDGNVYENLYKWAAASPLNKTQVHKSFQYLKPLIQAGNQSKL